MKPIRYVLWAALFFSAAAALAQHPHQVLSQSTHTAIGKDFVQAVERQWIPRQSTQTQPQGAEERAKRGVAISDQVLIAAAQQWLARHADWFDPNTIANWGTHLYVDVNGSNMLVIEGPGYHIVIILSNGPFLPTGPYEHELILQGQYYISNGI